jgi:hypothetical protein
MLSGRRHSTSCRPLLGSERVSGGDQSQPWTDSAGNTREHTENDDMSIFYLARVY